MDDLISERNDIDMLDINMRFSSASFGNAMLSTFGDATPSTFGDATPSTSLSENAVSLTSSSSSALPLSSSSVYPFVSSPSDNSGFTYNIALWCDYDTLVCLSQVNYYNYQNLAKLRERLFHQIPWTLVLEYVRQSGRFTFHITSILIGNTYRYPLESCPVCCFASWSAIEYSDTLGQIHRDILYQDEDGNNITSSQVTSGVWAGVGGDFLTKVTQEMRNYRHISGLSNIPSVVSIPFKYIQLEDISSCMWLLLPIEALINIEMENSDEEDENGRFNSHIKYISSPCPKQDERDDVRVYVGSLNSTLNSNHHTPNLEADRQRLLLREKFLNVREDKDRGIMIGWKISRSYYRNYYTIEQKKGHNHDIYCGEELDTPPIKRRRV